MKNVLEIKDTLHRVIANTDDMGLLMKLSEVIDLYDEAHDWWRRIPAEEKEAILEGLDQLERGEGIAHEEMIKKYKQWL